MILVNKSLVPLTHYKEHLRSNKISFYVSIAVRPDVSPAPVACSRNYCARCHSWTRSQVSRFYHATGDARPAFFFNPTFTSSRASRLFYLFIYLFTCVREMYRNGWRRTRVCVCVCVGVEQSVNVRRERRGSLELSSVCCNRRISMVDI